MSDIGGISLTSIVSFVASGITTLAMFILKGARDDLKQAKDEMKQLDKRNYDKTEELQKRINDLSVAFAANQARFEIWQGQLSSELDDLIEMQRRTK